jgi:hypothetical protein
MVADLVVHGAAIAGRLAGLPTASVGFGRTPDGPLAEAMFPLGERVVHISRCRAAPVRSRLERARTRVVSWVRDRTL